MEVLKARVGDLRAAKLHIYRHYTHKIYINNSKQFAIHQKSLNINWYWTKIWSHPRIYAFQISFRNCYFLRYVQQCCI